MQKHKKKTFMRERRHRRVRGSVHGTPDRPRLAVHRTLKQIYAQVIDDVAGTTLCASSSLALEKAGTLAEGAKGGNVAGAGSVGADLARKVKALGLTKVRFDRGGNRYHGRIKALADAARAEGLEF